MSNSVHVDKFGRFQVEPWIDRLGGFIAQRPRLWRRIGDWETRLLGRDLDDIKICQPIFICGLARSGSTILLECLADHSHTATHRYRDYPGVLAPVFWDRISARLYAGRSTPMERAHGDGIAVTSDSPEAMEEIIWMAFHPQSHDTTRNNSSGRGDLAPAFAAFYRDHIRKLLWLRQGRRYLSKGNYNLARLGALIELFPDARFIVPSRDPVTHIASLMRQHDLFSEAESRHPAALRYMQRVGHFEFGLDRRPLNLGHDEATEAVQQLWREGREVEGWSQYWANIHNFLADRLQEDAMLRDATLLVRFEDLCTDPTKMMERIVAHTRLPANDGWIAKLAERIRTPAYYTVPFDEAERQTIRQLTTSAACRLGYCNN